MNFHLRITFTGICAVVPNKKLTKKPTKIFIVLPNGETDTPTKGHAADESDLLRHRGFVRFNLRNLVGVSGIPKDPQEGQGIWYFGRRELKLDWAGKANKLKVGDMTDLLDLTAVAPDFSEVDKAVIMEAPDNLLARFLIQEGSLSTAADARGPWVIPNTLASKVIHMAKISHELNVELKDLERVELVGTPLDEGGTGAGLKLQAEEGETVEITVANLCDNNPLQWETKQDPKPDKDCKWHFQLLPDEKMRALRKAVLGMKLPIPRPVGDHNGRGIDCFPAATKPQSF